MSLTDPVRDYKDRKAQGCKGRQDGHKVQDLKGQHQVCRQAQESFPSQEGVRKAKDHKGEDRKGLDILPWWSTVCLLEFAVLGV